MVFFLFRHFSRQKVFTEQFLGPQDRYIKQKPASLSYDILLPVLTEKTRGVNITIRNWL